VTVRWRCMRRDAFDVIGPEEVGMANFIIGISSGRLDRSVVEFRAPTPRRRIVLFGARC
jgi:hypothetical protein